MSPMHAVDRPAVYSLTRPLQHVRATDLTSKLGNTSHLGDRLLRTAPPAGSAPPPHRLGHG